LNGLEPAPFNQDLLETTISIDQLTANPEKIEQAREVASHFYNSNIWKKTFLTGELVCLKGYIDALIWAVKRSSNDILDDFKLAHALKYVTLYLDQNKGLCIKAGERFEDIKALQAKDVRKGKKYSLFFGIPSIILCFVLVFSIGFEKTQKGYEEVDKIHQSAELVIRDYLKERIISGISYNPLPINYDKGRCIVGCRVDVADELGIKHRTQFDVLLEKKNKVWKATIVKVDKNLPIPKELKKSASWEFFIKSARKGR
jgi:hypothetical protein